MHPTRQKPFAKYLVPVAITCAVWPTLGLAQSGSSLSIYGRLNTGLEQVRVSGASGVTRVSNYRSVLGFRGEEALGGGLRALWQLEGSLALDSGAGSCSRPRPSAFGTKRPVAI